MNNLACLITISFWKNIVDIFLYGMEEVWNIRPPQFNKKCQKFKKQVCIECDLVEKGARWYNIVMYVYL